MSTIVSYLLHFADEEVGLSTEFVAPGAVCGKLHAALLLRLGFGQLGVGEGRPIAGIHPLTLVEKVVHS